jgi:segregation and condensation protein B
MQPEQLNPIVEAALLASTQPMTLLPLKGLFGEDEEVDGEAIAAALSALAADCEGRGVELVEVASGWRYQVRREVHGWVSRMWAEKPSRYSRALLETLALIAYRQPITRPEIEQIRGVVVSSNIIKTMEEREWIRVVGYRDVPGKPALFGTTRTFLDYFNLKSLDALPPLSDIRDLDEINPQMRLDGDAVPAAARAAMPHPGEATDGDASPDDAPAPVDASDAPSTEASSALPGDGAPANEPPAGDDDVAAAPSTADEAENPTRADDEDSDDAEKNTEESRA